MYVVTSMISNWENTRWRAIDSESMDMDLKRLLKELRSMLSSAPKVVKLLIGSQVS